MNNENPYADIENLYASNKTLQDQFQSKQGVIQRDQVNANTQNVVNQIDQQKGYANQDLVKETSAGYQDYQKSINPYGVQAEQTAQMGLGDSGNAESTMTNKYNTYQNRTSQAISTTNRIKADFDNKINDAKLSGNTDLAKIALQEYQTKIDALTAELNFKSSMTDKKVSQNNWKTQYDYTQKQDAQSQANWQTGFDYTKGQDAVAQNNWQKEYNLSSRKASSSGSNGYVPITSTIPLGTQAVQSNNLGTQNTQNVKSSQITDQQKLQRLTFQDAMNINKLLGR